MTMRVAIIDDEKQWVSHTKKLVEKYYNNPNVEVKGYLSGIQFMQKLQPFDIVIMDLEMPGQDGFQTISEYKKIYKKSIILILTSHMELAQKGYVVNAFRYINKANFTEELKSALNSIDALKSLDEKVTLNILNTGKRDIIISDIVFFETEKRNLKIHTTHDTFICTDSIGYVEKLLSSKGFFRTHRSYLVNLSMVRSYDKEDITMVNNETAMVSARKYRVFKQKYLDWKFEHASF